VLGRRRQTGAHLSALMTVHVKLLNIVRPDIALFGERDFQQLVMVRRLVD